MPNGGYLLTMLARAASASVPVHPDVLNATAYFLGPADHGEAEIRVEPVKLGKRTSVVSAGLHQQGRERARALLLLGDIDTLDGPTLETSRPPELPKPEACVKGKPPLTPLSLMDSVDIRYPAECMGFTQTEPSGLEPPYQAWMRFEDNRPIDLLSLLLFSDVLPPTIFNPLGFSGWVPTLELTVQVRRRPVEGNRWLRASMVTRDITAGHFEEDGVLFDDADRLVAVSRQRAMLLSR